MRILFVQKKTNNPISSLGSEELTVSIDLDDNSFTIDPIIESFVAFLIRVGVPYNVLPPYFEKAAEDLNEAIEYDSGGDHIDEHGEEEKSQKGLDINKMLKEHSNDIELLVNDVDSFNTFKQKIQTDDQFTREVFRVFLKDILEV